MYIQLYSTSKYEEYSKLKHCFVLCSWILNLSRISPVLMEKIRLCK